MRDIRSYNSWEIIFTTPLQPRKFYVTDTLKERTSFRTNLVSSASFILFSLKKRLIKKSSLCITRRACLSIWLKGHGLLLSLTSITIHHLRGKVLSAIINVTLLTSLKIMHAQRVHTFDVRVNFPLAYIGRKKKFLTLSLRGRNVV